MGAVAITGVRGYVGRRLAASLVAEGTAVVGLVRPGSTEPGSLPLGEDPEALADGLVRAGVSSAVHLAARYVRDHRPADVAPLVRDNVLAGAVLLDALRLAGVRRLVVADSYFAHDGPQGNEAADLYAATRQALAPLIRYHSRAWGLEVVRLVVYDVYGPDDPRPRLLPALVRACTSGEPLPLVADGGRLELVHVDDVVAAFRHALHAHGELAGGTWAVRGEAPLTVPEVAERLAAVAGRAVPVLPGARVPLPWTIPTPWRGPVLPGWSARTSLDEGLAALLHSAPQAAYAASSVASKPAGVEQSPSSTLEIKQS